MQPVHIRPEDFRRTPWKNGGGVTLTIAEAREPNVAPGDWSGVIWQFGRTGITAPGPFSDLTGFERLQTVVAGRGLVLESQSGEIDLREPLTVARYDGGLRIMSRLEDGPVEVVNLIARRTAGHIALRVLAADETAQLLAGRHVIYAFGDSVECTLNDRVFALESGHAATVDGSLELGCRKGHLLAATVRAD